MRIGVAHPRHSRGIRLAGRTVRDQHPQRVARIHAGPHAIGADRIPLSRRPVIHATVVAMLPLLPLLILLLAPVAALAQQPSLTEPPVVVTIGEGTVEAPPDRAW